MLIVYSPFKLKRSVELPKQQKGEDGLAFVRSGVMFSAGGSTNFSNKFKVSKKLFITGYKFESEHLIKC